MAEAVAISHHKNTVAGCCLVECFLPRAPVRLPIGGKGGKAQLGGGAGGGPPSIGRLLLLASALVLDSVLTVGVEEPLAFSTTDFDLSFDDVTEKCRWGVDVCENDDTGGAILIFLGGVAEYETADEGTCILCGRRTLVLVFATLGRGETCSRS